jgi:hypothetical protein
VLWIRIFLCNPLQIEDHWSERAGYLWHEPVEWHITKRENFVIFEVEKLFYSHIRKRQEKEIMKKGDEGATTIILLRHQSQKFSQSGDLVSPCVASKSVIVSWPVPQINLSPPSSPVSASSPLPLDR